MLCAKSYAGPLPLGTEARLAQFADLIAAAIANAESRAELRKALAHKPDVVVTDVQMPPRREDDGLAAAIELRRRLPSTSVLVLSQYYEESYALDLIGDHAAGVGYLLKERVGDVAGFVDAVRRVATGGSALDPEIVARMVGRRRNRAIDELTKREREVLAAMAEGKSNQRIADALIISLAAVEKNITAIMQKLGIGSGTSEHRRVSPCSRTSAPPGADR
jgi:DNA-binding NarL/FixJ family response regulator